MDRMVMFSWAMALAIKPFFFLNLFFIFFIWKLVIWVGQYRSGRVIFSTEKREK